MMNKVILQGRLCSDPELKKTSSDISVVSFDIAVQSDYSKDDSVEFIPCVAWRNNADFISKYFSKGKMILVSGFLHKRSYSDKEGNKRYVLEVVVDRSYFCASSGQTINNDVSATLTDSDIPF